MLEKYLTHNVGKFNFYEIINKIKDLLVDNPKIFPNKKFTIEISGILV